MTDAGEDRLSVDAGLRARAAKVIPGGMYGHQNVASLPARYPQFMRSGRGSHVWDVDGNEYIDLMCSYGPVLLGHRHPGVDEAAARQGAEADCQNGPSARMVELAEALTGTVEHADWAIFSKNGTDATTQCITIARAATGKRKILVASRAYHGAAPWCTPNLTGVLAEDRAHQIGYRFNDIASVEGAVAEAADDLAGIIVSPMRYDFGIDLELPDPAFAAVLRSICDRAGAVLILDDVRCGVAAPPRWQLGAARRGSRSERVEQGHRQRLRPRCCPRPGVTGPSRRVHLHHRFVLVRDRVHGRVAGHAAAPR
jgi:glutamate-1-semialdehyde 2,1-aminomutase